MLIKKSWLAPLIITSSALLSGCSTTKSFNHTPTASSEFSKSMSELKQTYSDIDEYDQTFVSAASTPKVSDLEILWGKPKVKKKWGEFALDIGLGVGLVSAGYATYPILAAFYLVFPPPREEYVWHKGKYEITANGRSDAFVLYEKRIHNWKWKEIPKAEDVVFNAQQVH